MIYEHLVILRKSCGKHVNDGRAFPENQFREVLFALKTSSYLFLTRKKTLWVSCHTNMKKFLFFADLLLVPSPANFQQFVSNRLTELEQNWPLCRTIIVFVIVMSLYL